MKSEGRRQCQCQRCGSRFTIYHRVLAWSSGFINWREQFCSRECWRRHA